MDQMRPDDSGAGRGAPMPEKPPYPAAFQPRPPGPPPQRYPINNGSAGPRLGVGQPPPNLPRLDSRSALGPGVPPGQFPPPRPPFGPPRPQPPGAPGQFPRGPPPQGPIRFPPGSPGIRGPYPPGAPGQRPTFNNPPINQLRPQRQGSLDPGQRFPPPGAGFPFNPENRLPTPRVAETVVNPIPTPREPTPDPKSIRPEARPRPEIRMETNGPNLIMSRPSSLNQKENIEFSPKRPISQTDDDDDDDVVMDNEKELKPQNSMESIPAPPANAINKTPSPEPRTPVKNEISASPSPASSRAPSAPPSKAPTPMPEEERSKSRLSENSRSKEDDNEVNERSRPPSGTSSRSGESPTKSIARSLDLQSGGRSPEIKSPVVGFDNGRQRSLSARSQSPAGSPKTPGTPKSEKKTTFVEDNRGSKTERPSTGSSKPGTPVKSPTRLQTPKSGMRRSASGRSIKSEGGSESGANQTTQNGSPTTNGVAVSPIKKLPIKSKDVDKPRTAGSPIKSPSKSVKSLPRTPEAGPPSTADKKSKQFPL